MVNDLCPVWLRDGLEFVFSPDVIPSGWLGSKQQQTNKQTIPCIIFFLKCRWLKRIVKNIRCFILFWYADFRTRRIWNGDLCWASNFLEKLLILGAVRNETVAPCERCSHYRSSFRGTLTTNLYNPLRFEEQVFSIFYGKKTGQLERIYMNQRRDSSKICSLLGGSPQDRHWS